MPRYIDAEQISDLLGNEYLERLQLSKIRGNESQEKVATGINYSRNIINNKIPTADVQELKHGKWVFDKENECWYCSLCEYSALNNYRGLSVESNYCPHCGAKMGGE